jgi:hypothetical protein
MPLADSNHAIETSKENYERAANRDPRELCKVCALKIDLRSICSVEDVVCLSITRPSCFDLGVH